jgi:HEAT repeat protein
VTVKNSELNFIEDFHAEEAGAYQILLSYATNANSEVRMRAIEKLGEINATSSIGVIKAGIKDKDYLVRASSLQVLGDWKIKGVFDQIVDALNDKELIVRMAAAEALGSIGDLKSVPVLKNHISSAKDNELAPTFYSLALLDDKNRENWFDKLAALLLSKNYRARCAAANLLAISPLDKKLEETIKKLKMALVIEKAVAAKSSITKAISELEKS